MSGNGDNRDNNTNKNNNENAKQAAKKTTAVPTQPRRSGEGDDTTGPSAQVDINQLVATAAQLAVATVQAMHLAQSSTSTSSRMAERAILEQNGLERRLRNQQTQTISKLRMQLSMKASFSITLACMEYACFFM